MEDRRVCVFGNSNANLSDRLKNYEVELLSECLADKTQRLDSFVLDIDNFLRNGQPFVIVLETSNRKRVEFTVLDWES
jgi:hypothetical protein